MKHFVLAALFLVIAVPTARAADPAPRDAEEITIAAVGDLMLGGRTEPFLEERGPAYPFAHVLPVLERADIVVGNLECPISTRGEAVKNKKFTLRAGPLAARALKEAGIRVVTLANNHAMDFGPLALEDTLAALDEQNVLATGAGMNLTDARSPAVIKVKGMTLAFLAYSLTFPLDFYASPGHPGTAPGYADFVRADIKRARSRADLVIVSFHWGGELRTAAKDYQIELGRKAVDWGADVVLGHHPHVLEELEVYKGRIIAYSLGNFVFGSESNRTNTSIILLLTFRNRALARVEAVPLDVNNYRVKYRPRVLTGPPAEDVLNEINAGSERFGTRLDIVDSVGSLALLPEKPAPAAEAPRPVRTSGLSAPAPRNSPRTSSGTGGP